MSSIGTSSLGRQLELYENGELEKLDDILTPSLYSGSNQTTADLEVEKVLNVIGGHDEGQIQDRMTAKPSEADKPISIVQSDHPSVDDNDEFVASMSDEDGGTITNYPKITNTIKDEINRIATEWIRLDEGLDKLNQAKRELGRQQKQKEAALLNYIQSYGLKDITKGRHQLVPTVVKGKKKSTNKRHIESNLKDFLAKLGIQGDAEELAIEASDLIENNRETGDDRVKLTHNRL